MPSVILLLLFSIVVGGLAGWMSHYAKRRRRETRIPTQHGKHSKKMIGKDGALLTGEQYWQPPQNNVFDAALLSPEEAVYLMLWFKDMSASPSSAIRRGLKNNGWFTLPISLLNDSITEARRLDGEPHRWALGKPGAPLSAMRLMTHIGPDMWVLDDKAQYTLSLEPLQCVVEFGSVRVLWLSGSMDAAEDDVDSAHSHQGR